MTGAVVESARAAEARHLLQVYAQLPIEPRSAEGVHLHCGGDRRVLDLYGGHAVAALGYAHPELLAALAEQAEALFFQSNAVALEVRARAAEALTAFAGGALPFAFFTNSGAEANENALRLALRATGRARVVALEHGFHGRTAAAGAVTWGSAGRWYAFPRTPFDVAFVPRDDPERAVRSIDTDTAAVILELVQGVGGAYDLAPDYVAAVRDACRASGALLIADEVQTGMGRTGSPFAAQAYGVAPDILTTAKSLCGGFPCGAMLVTESLADSVGQGELGSTFGGGPMPMALVAKTIEVIGREGLLERVRGLSDRLRTEARIGPVERVQGRGFLLGLRCRVPARDVQAALLARDILVGTSADPHVVRLLPPLILEAHHVDTLVAALDDIGEET